MKYTGIWCDFWAIDFNQMSQLLKHVWQREVSEDELAVIGERIWNLGRLFNLREGVEADTLPARLIAEAFKDGPSAGKAIGLEAFAEATQEYYRSVVGTRRVCRPRRNWPSSESTSASKVAR